MNDKFTKAQFFSLLKYIRDLGLGEAGVRALASHLDEIFLNYKIHLKLTIWQFENFFFALCHKVETILRINIAKYEDRISRQLALALKAPKWSLNQFFAFAVGFHFVSDLNTRQYAEAADPHNPEATLLYQRSMMVTDVVQIETEAENCFKEPLKMIKAEAVEYGYTEAECPIDWLELIERLIVYIQRTRNGRSYGVRPLGDSMLSREIRCNLHKIDINLVEKGVPCEDFETYNVMQLAEAIGKRTGNTVSQDDVLRFCLNNNFGVYIKSEVFPVRDGYQLKHPPTRAEVADALAEGLIEDKYKVPYEGLVRLYKSSDHPWHKKSTLKGLLSTNKLVVLHSQTRLQSVEKMKTSLSFLPIQPSVGQYIFGINKVVSPDAGQAASEIIPDDLIFVRNEVDPYLEAIPLKQGEAESQSVRAKKRDDEPQKLRRTAIIKIYPKFTGHAWERRFQREEENGLIAAKVPGSSPYLYFQEKVESWLIQNGHYTKQEIQS